MTDVPPVIDFAKWIAEYKHVLKPPVANRMVWEPRGDFIVQVVGGPNLRTDFHLDPYEEWFYQVRGAMHVNLMTDDGPARVDIGEGEMWVLPRLIPHSPQRPDPDSIGIVIERIREEGTTEEFRWYCLSCAHPVHSIRLQMRDIVKDLPPVFEAFYSDTDARTCDNCGTFHPGKTAI